MFYVDVQKYYMSVILFIFLLFCQNDLEELEKNSVKKNQCNFLTLSAWYKERVKSRGSKSPRMSPRKKLKSKPTFKVDKGPVLVIIIPNVEGFSPQILQHFILIAR
jgi:Origin recognition complex (ORC) subunit 3 N-terminus.